ncbi:hypothetical protein [Streptomyces sp. NBC_00286]|uniref:hypothetical protein n=1 Tax=Streptomyces sp. NBC_00286 TaxID=2975701 RepID=UPI002E2CB2F1|nr:hypothetical protein [Streptomyces sp. NBC_00286]
MNPAGVLYLFMEPPAGRLVVAELHRRTMKTTDGHAARETLTHPLFTALATDQEVRDCRALLVDCALGAGSLPSELRGQLAKALRKSDHVIREDFAHLGQAYTIGQE